MLICLSCGLLLIQLVLFLGGGWRLHVVNRQGRNTKRNPPSFSCKNSRTGLKTLEQTSLRREVLGVRVGRGGLQHLQCTVASVHADLFCHSSAVCSPSFLVFAFEIAYTTPWHVETTIVSPALPLCFFQFKCALSKKKAVGKSFSCLYCSYVCLWSCCLLIQGYSWSGLWICLFWAVIASLLYLLNTV